MNVVELIIASIAPVPCAVCSTGVKPLCEACVVNLPPIEISRCVSCNTLTESSKQCAVCRAKHGLSYVWSVCSYDESAKQIVARYKFKRLQILHKQIARLMVEALPYNDFDAVCVVPTAPQRIRQRGYDHAELLGKQIARTLGVSYLVPLRRIGAQEQRLGGRRQRQEWAQQSYAVSGQAVAGKRLLLVDDVVSTGATLTTCSAILKKAGAKRVDGLVFAINQA